MKSAQQTIERSVTVAGSLAQCWRSLTDPAEIGLWFADVEGSLDRPGAAFSFHFGDGDFFRGSVLERDEPTALRFQWQFMGIGGVSLITIHVKAVDEHASVVTVLDEGEYSDRAVTELSEGWDDFLSRLAKKMATGENARYRWSEQIDAGVIVATSVSAAQVKARDLSWWRAAFPANVVNVSATRDGAVVVFSDPAWAGQETKASVTVSERSSGAGISISHTGWLNLNPEIQLHERKRFADLWATALRRLKNEFEAATAGVAS